MTWKEKSCEKCVFRVGVMCRRFPPITTKVNGSTRTAYPLVTIHEEFIPACAEYAELLGSDKDEI